MLSAVATGLVLSWALMQLDTRARKYPPSKTLARPWMAQLQVRRALLNGSSACPPP